MPRLSGKRAKQLLKAHKAKLKNNPDFAAAERYVNNINVAAIDGWDEKREAIHKAYLAGLRLGKKRKTKTIIKKVYYSYDRDSLA